MATPYATTDDVQVLLAPYALTLGLTSTPTLTQVQRMLDQVGAEIDGILTARGYGTVPAAGTNDVLLLGRFVAEKAAARAFHAAFGADDSPDGVKQWGADYAEFVLRLRKGEQRLIDQTPRSRIGTILSGAYIED